MSQSWPRLQYVIATSEIVAPLLAGDKPPYRQLEEALYCGLGAVNGSFAILDVRVAFTNMGVAANLLIAAHPVPWGSLGKDLEGLTTDIVFSGIIEPLFIANGIMSLRFQDARIQRTPSFDNAIRRFLGVASDLPVKETPTIPSKGRSPVVIDLPATAKPLKRAH
jgi:hypothetical protein